MKTDPQFDPSLLSATGDSALSALQQVGGLAPGLVEAWVKAGNADAVNEVAERGTGAARKAARRGINVLKARGITIPAHTHVSTLLTPETVTEEAWLLAPDSTGSVCLVVTYRTTTTRARAAFVFLNDAVGVYRVQVGELSQSQLKDAISQALPAADYKPTKVPLEWARYRIAQARKKHPTNGYPEPLGFTTAHSLLSPAPTEAPEHPFDAEGLELSEEDARELAKNSSKLHILPEFRAWFPQKSAVDELLQRVGQEIGPDPQDRPEQLAQILSQQVEAATDRYFTPEVREGLLHMMKDSALSVLSREGEVRALEVVAAMKVIQVAGLITNPPREVPFLKAFFEKALSFLTAQNRGQLQIPVRPPAPPGAPSVSQPEPEVAASEEPALAAPAGG